MTHSTLNDATPRRNPNRFWHLAVLPLPVWCWVMPFAIFEFAGREIDAIWFLAMLLPLAVGTGCCAAGHYKLMWYSFGVLLGVLAINFALPSLNRAT